MKRQLYETFIKIFVAFSKFFAFIIPAKDSSLILIDLNRALLQTKSVNLAGKPLYFQVTSADTYFRFKKFLVKEPETLEWISSFNTSDIFWDIGANIGVYSLFAAHRGIRTFAFEPSFANYNIISRNNYINKFSDKLSILPLAFSNKNGIANFNMGDVEEGGAANQLGPQQKEFLYSGIAQLQVAFNQSVLMMTIDDCIKSWGVEFPTHVKIDVDGVEPLILNGALLTLADRRLKSVLVELNENDESHAQLIPQMKNLGFTPQRYSLNDPKYSFIANYIFRR